MLSRASLCIKWGVSAATLTRAEPEHPEYTPSQLAYHSTGSILALVCPSYSFLAEFAKDRFAFLQKFLPEPILDSS
jgi:hypothetical protein